jgi:pleckstrin homology domain-containing family H
MRDARVEDVEHVSDSDSEEKNDDARNHLTVAIYPQHQVTGVSDTNLTNIVL